MFTIWPLTFGCALAFRSMFWLASILTAAWEVISTPLPLSFSLPLVALTVTSASAVMATVLSLALMTMLFLPVLSMISIFSSPSASVRRITWPLRVLRARTLFLPSLLSSGGLSLPFHSPPSTYSESGRPCSKATSTSSSTSGSQYRPRPAPAMAVTTRAQSLWTWSSSQGSFTLTLPSPSGSLLLVTIAMATPVKRPSVLSGAVRRENTSISGGVPLDGEAGAVALVLPERVGDGGDVVRPAEGPARAVDVDDHAGVQLRAPGAGDGALHVGQGQLAEPPGRDLVGLGLAPHRLIDS